MLLQTRDGFTLLELLIAILIMSILILVAVPAFTTFLQNYRISSSADDLYYHLQLARAESIKRNTNVYVSFTTGDTWCYGINTGSNCDCTTASNCNLGAVSYSSARQASLATSGMTNNYIYFEGSHSAANASASVTFTAYGQTSPLITLSVGRMGNITMCSTGISGYTAC